MSFEGNWTYSLVLLLLQVNDVLLQCQLHLSQAEDFRLRSRSAGFQGPNFLLQGADVALPFCATGLGGELEWAGWAPSLNIWQEMSFACSLLLCSSLSS